jgi:ubiquinone/menaquinone biosynthesis C-methylase UbiE
MNISAVYNDFLLEPLMKNVKKSVAGHVNDQGGKKSILDLCCSTGKQCGYYSRLEMNAIGLDLDFRLLRDSKQKRKDPGVQFLCSHAMRLPFKENSLHRISLVFALHDKDPSTKSGIMKETARVLSDDGSLFIADIDCPKKNLCQILISIGVFVLEMFSGHFANYLRHLAGGGLVSLIKNANFTINKTYYYRWPHAALYLAKKERRESHEHWN